MNKGSNIEAALTDMVHCAISASMNERTNQTYQEYDLANVIWLT